MKPTTEIINWLREIVSQEPWNEEDLAEWANEFLRAYEEGSIKENGVEEIWEQQRRHEEQAVSALKPLVGPYRHDPSLPVLPDKPDGQLHGIGFIYDEDRDDRVLVAIDDLKTKSVIVALAEHEGTLRIYTRLPIDESSINVCGDEWVVEEFVPYQGIWKEVTSLFKRECLAKVVGHGK